MEVNTENPEPPIAKKDKFCEAQPPMLPSKHFPSHDDTPLTNEPEHHVNFDTEHTPSNLDRRAANFTHPMPIERPQDTRDQNKDVLAFEHERMMISNRRNNNLSLQAKIHEKRVILRDKQNAKSVLEDNLIQRVRMQELGFFPDTIDDRRDIMDIVQEFQSVRDTYGPLEDECNELEDCLAREEFELYQQEEEFYQSWDFKPISRLSPIGCGFEVDWNLR